MTHRHTPPSSARTSTLETTLTPPLRQSATISVDQFREAFRKVYGVELDELLHHDLLEHFDGCGVAAEGEVYSAHMEAVIAAAKDTISNDNSLKERSLNELLVDDGFVSSVLSQYENVERDKFVKQEIRGFREKIDEVRNTLQASEPTDLVLITKIWNELDETAGMYTVTPGCHDASQHEQRRSDAHRAASAVGRGDANEARSFLEGLLDNADRELVDIEQRCADTIDGKSLLTYYLSRMSDMMEANQLAPTAGNLAKMIERINNADRGSSIPLEIPLSCLDAHIIKALDDGSAGNKLTQVKPYQNFWASYLEGRLEMEEEVTVPVLIAVDPLGDYSQQLCSWLEGTSMPTPVNRDDSLQTLVIADPKSGHLILAHARDEYAVLPQDFVRRAGCLPNMHLLGTSGNQLLQFSPRPVSNEDLVNNPLVEITLARGEKPGEIVFVDARVQTLPQK